MADDRVVVDLVVTGAQESVRQILSVASATTGLATVTESAGVRQRITYDQVAEAAARSAQLQESAAKRAQAAIQQAEEQTTKTVVANAARQADARRAAAQAANQRATTTRAQLGGAAPLGGLLDRIGQGQPAILSQIAAETEKVTVASTKKNKALADQSNEHTKNRTSGISYLSVLSAIHAASFLATNQTFSMVGSFATLGLAFSKLGVAAAGIGLIFGGFLGIFGQVSQAIEQIKQAALGLVEVFVKVGAGIAVAIGAAAATSVNVAAGVETQLASVRAFGNATVAELRQVAEQASELGRRFGVSIAAVVEATSLFARAGGNVEQAINGATEAIIKLQVASQGELTAAQAALAVSAALKQFNLAGEEAIRVADNLAAAAQGSALSFTGVTQAFIQAVPGARTFGLTIEDLAGGIALLGDQLVKGTITGTAFKQFLISLVNPSAEAKREMAALGISIQDSSGKIRPFIDIAKDLNEALGENAVATGKITQAEAARASNVIFSSRAVLAATIISREGAEAIARYNDELAAVSVNNIVNVLLLPLNKQLERLKINVEAAGEAFGGSLLGPARAVVGGLIGLFDSIIPAAKLAGQAVASIATGQGFEALQLEIAKIAGNNNLTAFLIELVNSFRNVRDVILNQIIPAIQIFVNTVTGITGSNDQLTNMASAFDSVNKAIQFVGAAAAGAIVALGNLVVQIINNEGRGKELRDTIAKLAEVLLTQLVISVATTITFLGIAIALMPTLARLALLTASTLLSLADAFKNVTLKAIDFNTQIQKTLASPINPLEPFDPDKLDIDKLTKKFDAIDAAANKAKQDLGTSSDLALSVANDIVKVLPELDRLAAGIAGLGPTSKDAATVAKKSVEEITNELIIASGVDVDLLTQEDVQQFAAHASAIKQAAVGQISPIVTLFDQAQGQLADSLANIRAEVERTQRQAAAGLTGSVGVTPPEIDTKAIESATKKIEEAGRDLSRRLANLAEDSSTRVTNIIERSLERLGDIEEKTKISLSKLARDTQQRIDEIQEAVFQRRDDRQATEDFGRFIDERIRTFERGLDTEQRLQDRQLDAIRTARQRNNEDVNRDVERAFADLERIQQRAADAQERSFQHLQDARNRAFDLQQSLEEKAFARNQDREATARDDALKLAQAKTPEDRANVLASIDQAKKDVQFRQGQEDRFTAFKLQQDKKRIDQQKTEELAAASFRQGQEDKFTKFRRDQELILIQFRRNQENLETFVRQQEEDKQLQRRLENEDKLLARRRENETLLRNFQDNLENQATQRQINKVNQEASDRAKDLTTEAQRQAKEVFDAAQIQLTEQTKEIDKTIRNIQQSLVDITDSLPPEVLASVFGELAKAQTAVAAGSEKVVGSFEAQKQAALSAIAAQQAVLEASLITSTPRFTPPTLGDLQGLQPTIPLSVVTAQVLHAASIVLPAGFSDSVSQAVLNGMQQAADRGLLTQDTPEIDLTPVVEPLQSMQRFFGA